MRSPHIESICSVLKCTPEECMELYDNRTDILAEEALLHIIQPRRECLRAAEQRYRLDDLLSAMLEHAPDECGKRYVAVALHVAHKRGDAAVIDVAKSWMDYLFLPVLTASINTTKTEPSSGQTPTIDATTEHVEAATRSVQSTLRKQVSTRERHRCAITHEVDVAFVRYLVKQKLFDQIPTGPHRRMATAHIIPFSLNEFSEKERGAAYTWDMFLCWTNIDIQKLARDKINSPENAIFMTADDRISFGQFRFYFDKEAYPAVPNKYMVRMTGYVALSNGQAVADVEFQPQAGVEPPDPVFLRVHAAFARVLHLCGAADYVHTIEETDPALGQHSPMDFASMLRSRLVVLQHSSPPVFHRPNLST